VNNWLWIAGATGLTLPGLLLRLGGIQAEPQIEAALFGLSLLGAAFLLSWACAAAQIEVPQPLALAALALIAVLPEYAVDGYFAWTAAKDPEYVSYATANMTGANRLLVGIGWPMVIFLCWLRGRRRASVSVEVEKDQTIELSFLVLATLYSFIIPIKGRLGLEDAGVLVTIFGLYIWASSKGNVQEPHLGGPSATIGALPKRTRRLVTVLLFLFPAAVILAAAEPFAEGLIDTGEVLGVDEFILVQWLAPLASEAPELMVVAIFTLAGSAGAAIGTLISSKVNQWTLLVGTLPLIYTVSLGGVGSLDLDSRQVEEILLTGAQSAFAIALLANLRLSSRGGAALFLLFITQLFFTDPMVRYGYSAVYLAGAMAMLLRDRGRIAGLWGMMKETAGVLRSPGRQ
jgi:cation:H+ antiporter